MAASRFNPLTGAALAALIGAATLLAGCEQHHVAPAQEATVAAPRPDMLAGAPPEPMPYPPAAIDAGPSFAPPPGPPPRAGDRDVVYDLGPVVRPRDTMAPIPNPPEAPRLHHRYAAAPPPRHAHVRRARRVGMHRPAHAAAPAHRTTPRPAAAVHGAAPAATPKAMAHGAMPPVQHAKPLGAKPTASPKATPNGKPATRLAPAAAGAPATGGSATKLAALQSALKDSVARTALLNAPELKPDQPTDVTLTLPADFASVMRDQSEKQGLQDSAASVNVTARLAGDGYAVAPDETQSQPLTVGQPTEFHWTVTAQQGAKGPLRADVGADLLGGGDQTLQLGSVSPAGKGGLHVSPRAWGAALLVLLAVLVFAWLSRGGRASAARRRQNTIRSYERPLDIGVPPAPPPVDREV